MSFISQEFVYFVCLHNKLQYLQTLFETKIEIILWLNYIFSDSNNNEMYPKVSKLRYAQRWNFIPALSPILCMFSYKSLNRGKQASSLESSSWHVCCTLKDIFPSTQRNTGNRNSWTSTYIHMSISIQRRYMHGESRAGYLQCKVFTKYVTRMNNLR